MRFTIACLSIATTLLAAGCERAETPAAADASAPAAVEPVQAPAPANGATSFEVALTGAEQAPDPGDQDGTGTAKITLDATKGEVCYELMVQNVDKPNAAHVHNAPAGQAGPPVVILDPPAEGSSTGCAAVDANVIADIQRNPANYYVNVHNAEFPGGAVRGQLGASSAPAS